MSLFNKILDVFFEESPSGPGQLQQPGGSAAGGAGAAQTNRGSIAPASPPPAYTGRPAVDSAIYNNFVEVLARAIEAENLPGFDFFEFHRIYKKFIEEGKSEQESLKTALTSAETMRVERNTLLANYQHYRKILESQQKVFEQDLKNYLDKNIDGPKKRVLEIDEDIKKKTGLIRQYEADIESLKNQKSGIGVDVEKSTLQLENVRTAFAKAYESIMNDFNTVFDKLKSM